MRVPLPRNRLVALALLGALLTGAVSLGLASPALWSGADAPDAGGAASQQLANDAPTPNADFTPAVQTQSAGGEHEEHEAYEEEHEEEEHEED
ncbi:MAG: hypothetical protein ABEJ06_06625 [Haloarculaceae archaeon]